MRMLEVRPEDIIHKSHLQRLLIEIVDDPTLSQSLAFKGGTCAAMFGYLDRFSVDLDFDLVRNNNEAELRKVFQRVFNQSGFSVTLEFDKVLFFQLRYPSSPGKRNTLKVSASSLKVKSNQYRVQHFPEIDRMIRQPDDRDDVCKQTGGNNGPVHTA